MEVDGVDGQMRFWREHRASPRWPRARRTTLPAGILGYEWDERPRQRLPTGGSRPSLDRDRNTAATVSRTTAAPTAAAAPPTISRCTAPPAARSSSAPAPSSGPGVWTQHTTTAARRPTRRVRQATVNLLADMGAQPATSSVRPHGGDATHRHDRADVEDHLARGRRHRDGRHRRHDQRHGDRRGRPRRRRRGLRRRRHDVASRRRPRVLDLPLDAEQLGRRDTEVARRRRLGNLETPSAGVTVGGGTPPPATCPCTIFGTRAPQVPADTDTAAVELGVKFRAAQAGSITGVRFYKGSGNTGSHTGSLWTNTGTRLATGDLRRRDGDRVADAHLQQPGGGHRRHHLRGVVLRAGRPVRLGHRLLHLGGDHERAAHRAARTARTVATASTATAPEGASRPAPTPRRTTGWTSSSPRPLRPRTPRRRRHVPHAGPGATGSRRRRRSRRPSATTSTPPPGRSRRPTARRRRHRRRPPRDLRRGWHDRDADAARRPHRTAATYTATLSGVKDAAGNAAATTDLVVHHRNRRLRTGACSLWTASTTPSVVADPDTASVEVGVRFSASRNGSISAIRFYKGAGNTGTHVVKLWTATGTLLASATATGESASGWQTVPLPSPVTVTAGTDVRRLLPRSGRSLLGRRGLLRHCRDQRAADRPATPRRRQRGLPYGRAPRAALPELHLQRLATTGSTSSSPDRSTAQQHGTHATSRIAHDAPSTPLRRHGGSTTGAARRRRALADDGGARGRAALGAVAASAATCPCSIFTTGQTPANPSENDTAAVELGVKFRADVAGFITGIRFYKGTGNTGTHVGNLWTAAGTLLATVTFTGETATGWQQASFATPVAVTANTTYVASYYARSGGTTPTTATSPPRASTTLHCTRWRTGSTGATASTATAPAAASRPAPTSRPTTGSTSSSAPADGHHQPTVTDRRRRPAPPASRRPPTSGDLQRVGARQPGRISVTDASRPRSPAPRRTTTAPTPRPSRPAAALAPSTTYTVDRDRRDGHRRQRDGPGRPGPSPRPRQQRRLPVHDLADHSDADHGRRRADTSAVELGSEVPQPTPAGYVTGIRFYKGTGNTGTHVGSPVERRPAPRLATVTFSGETATGWQQVSFGAPVAGRPPTRRTSPPTTPRRAATPTTAPTSRPPPRPAAR